MPRSSETPPSGRALLVTGLRRCDGITRGCPYQATSQHHGKEQQTSIEAPAARHSGAGRNPETTPGTAPPAQTGIPRPKPHQTPHWLPACAGTTESSAVALAEPHRSTTVEHSKRPRKPKTPVIPAKAGIQNPHPVPRHTPEAGDERPEPHQAPHQPPEPAPRDRSPTQRQTAHRPTPVRRARAGLRLHPRQPCTTANPRLD